MRVLPVAVFLATVKRVTGCWCQQGGEKKKKGVTLLPPLATVTQGPGALKRTARIEDGEGEKKKKKTRKTGSHPVFPFVELRETPGLARGGREKEKTALVKRPAP